MLMDLAHCSIVVWAVLLGKVSVLKLQPIKMQHVTARHIENLTAASLNTFPTGISLCYRRKF